MKIKLSIALFTILGFGFLLSSAAKAQTSTFKPEPVCNDPIYNISVKDYAPANFLNKNSTQLAEIVKEYGHLCVNRDTVGTLSYVGTVLNNPTLDHLGLNFCGDSSQYNSYADDGTVYDGPDADRCCPEPNQQRTGIGTFGALGRACCPMGTKSASIDLTTGVRTCNIGAGVVAVAPSNLLTYGPLSNTLPPYFKESENRYFCDIDGCVLSGSTLSVPASAGYSDAQAGAATCLLPGADVPGQAGKVCFQGTAMDKAEYEKLGPAAIQACVKLSGQDRDSCTACFHRNLESGQSNFVYSSIGCVDTSRDGLVTRIFQIGIGVMTGVILLRFIQSAILRLSAEPDKIQEAYDITNSSIIALITLVGAVVILRVIGINVLQIFPTNFLQ